MAHLPPINPPVDVVRRSDQARQLNVAGNPNKPLPTDKRLVAAGSSNLAIAGEEAEGGMKVFDYNFHSVKKGVSSGLLDVALLMANISQLKSVYMNGPDTPFYPFMMALLIISIVLQLAIGVLIIWLGRININDADEKKHKEAELLNNIAVTAIFLLTLVNIFITAIGITEGSASNKNSNR
uniref:Uncharacterized protein n=1 Tax=Plectus sambesii TaxID=2011161 RepID=A0A914VN65_9BILA